MNVNTDLLVDAQGTGYFYRQILHKSDRALYETFIVVEISTHRKHLDCTQALVEPQHRNRADPTHTRLQELSVCSTQLSTLYEQS